MRLYLFSVGSVIPNYVVALSVVFLFPLKDRTILGFPVVNLSNIPYRLSNIRSLLF